MAIVFKPFDELFAHEYQLTYISTDGHISVGPYTYSVFHYYTMSERQIIFQQCEKHLPWEHTQEQEQWEKTMYMYQWVIKSPPPFPYEEYTLSEEIKMAITWNCEINDVDPEHFRADVNFNRVNDLTGAEENYNYSRVIIETAEQRAALLDLCWTEHLETIAKQTAIDTFISNLEQLAKSNLEAREV